MPFDSPVETPLARGFKLVETLRNLPPDHDWDFNIHGGWKARGGTVGCAMCLIDRMWPELAMSTYVGIYGAIIGLCPHEGRSCFGWQEYENPRERAWCFDGKTHPADVTPEMVADAVESFLLAK